MPEALQVYLRTNTSNWAMQLLDMLNFDVQEKAKRHKREKFIQKTFQKGIPENKSCREKKGAQNYMGA